MLPEGIKNSTLKKIVVVPEQQRFEDGFIPPSKFYIIDYMGDGVFFRTHSRATAQSLADEIYGKNFFLIKQIVLAQAR